MQMIDVLKRLAELDDANGGIKESTKLVNDPKIATITESAGIAPIAECGPMGMPGMPGQTPASFSINASAASGDEVASMLTQIMTLAGVPGGGKEPMGEPAHAEQPGHSPLTGEPPEGSHGGQNDIQSALAAIDQAQGPMGTEDEGAGETPDVGNMADEVRDMADELSGTSKDELGLESFDNSPNPQVRDTDPLNDFANIINKVRNFDYTPPASGSNPMKAEGTESKEAPVQETSLLDLTNKLFQDYQSFVSESQKKK